MYFLLSKKTYSSKWQVNQTLLSLDNSNYWVFHINLLLSIYVLWLEGQKLTNLNKIVPFPGYTVPYQK